MASVTRAGCMRAPSSPRPARPAAVTSCDARHCDIGGRCSIYNWWCSLLTGAATRLHHAIVSRSSSEAPPSRELAKVTLRVVPHCSACNNPAQSARLLKKCSCCEVACCCNTRRIVRLSRSCAWHCSKQEKRSRRLAMCAPDANLSLRVPPPPGILAVEALEGVALQMKEAKPLMKAMDEFVDKWREVAKKVQSADECLEACLSLCLKHCKLSYRMDGRKVGVLLGHTLMTHFWEDDAFALVCCHANARGPGPRARGRALPEARRCLQG